MTQPGSEMQPADVQATFCATLVDQWARLGLHHAVVAPGSRSTPMALALAARDELAIHVVHDERVVEWLRTAHATTTFTTSVCTGSIVLGAAGLLNGLTATTHWSCYPELQAQGATPVADRVVEHLDRRIITAAGVSSGIDMALRLVELLVDRTAAEAAQLMIEYDPQPPFACGSVAATNATADGGTMVMHRVIEYAQLRQ